jgi:hypothetical protein
MVTSPADHERSLCFNNEAKASNQLVTLRRIISFCRRKEQVPCLEPQQVLLLVGCFLCFHQQERVSCLVQAGAFVAMVTS